MRNILKDSYGLTIWASLAILLLGIIVIAIPCVWVSYYQSCYQASVFNHQFGTDWSCKDFFWASDQINTQSQTLRLEGTLK